MKDSKTLFCSLNFPQVSERASSKFVDGLGTRPQKGSPGLFYIPQKLQFLLTLLLLINSKKKMFNFLKFKLQNVLNSKSIWKRIISQTTYWEVKYKFEYCSLHFFLFSFIFCELNEKVLQSSIDIIYENKKVSWRLENQSLNFLNRKYFLYPKCRNITARQAFHSNDRTFYCKTHTHRSIYDAQ